MKLHVLGAGCARCRQLYQQVEQAVAASGVDAELRKVEDLDEIVKFGVPFTPALVIDGEIKCQGSIPTQAQILAWLSPSGGK